MNFLSTLFNAGKNLLGGAGQVVGQGAKGIMDLGAKFGQSGFNPMSLFGGGKNQPDTMAMPSFSKPKMSSSASMPVTANVGFNGTTPEKPAKKGLGILDQLFPGGKAQGMAGMIAPLLGDMFAPKTPDIPNFNSLSSVQALQGFKPGNSVSPEYQNMIQNNTKQLREQKVRELQALYHNARPGTDYLTDSNYQRDLANLDKGIQDNMTDELAKAEGTFSQQEQERLSELAQMDIYSIMAQTGMKAQEAQQFKEMFGNVGNMFLTNATKQPNQLEDIMKLFGGA